MKHIALFLVMIFFFSCKEKKIEFIQSETIGNLILIKNPPKNDSLIKKEIEIFFTKNPPKYSIENTIYIYKYSSNTEYFLTNDEDDGGPTSSHFLSNYQDEDGIAVLMIKKYEKDTTKLVGELKF